MSERQKLNIVDFKDLEHVTIVAFGDNHVGSKHCDEDLLKRHIDWVMKTPNNFALFIGDNIDAATRDSVGAGVYEQSEIIQEQMEHWCDLVRPLANHGKIIGTHDGNHERRVWKSSGILIGKVMAKDLGIKYLGPSVMHLVRVGGESYTMYSTHGSGGSRLPHTKIKAVLDRANMVDAEVYVMGHLHNLSHHVRQYYFIDKKSKSVREGEKHFVICGSYLNHWNSYAEEAGYEMMKKGSAKIKLSGLEHRIRVSL